MNFNYQKTNLSLTKVNSLLIKITTQLFDYELISNIKYNTDLALSNIKKILELFFICGEEIKNIIYYELNYKNLGDIIDKLIKGYQKLFQLIIKTFRNDYIYNFVSIEKKLRKDITYECKETNLDYKPLKALNKFIDILKTKVKKNNLILDEKPKFKIKSKVKKSRLNNSAPKNYFDLLEKKEEINKELKDKELKIRKLSKKKNYIKFNKLQNLNKDNNLNLFFENEMEYKNEINEIINKIIETNIKVYNEILHDKNNLRAKLDNFLIKSEDYNNFKYENICPNLKVIQKEFKNIYIKNLKLLTSLENNQFANEKYSQSLLGDYQKEIFKNINNKFPKLLRNYFDKINNLKTQNCIEISTMTDITNSYIRLVFDSNENSGKIFDKKIIKLEKDNELLKAKIKEKEKNINMYQIIINGMNKNKSIEMSKKNIDNYKNITDFLNNKNIDNSIKNNLDNILNKVLNMDFKKIKGIFSKINNLFSKKLIKKTSIERMKKFSMNSSAFSNKSKFGTSIDRKDSLFNLLSVKKEYDLFINDNYTKMEFLQFLYKNCNLNDNQKKIFYLNDKNNINGDLIFSGFINHVKNFALKHFNCNNCKHQIKFLNNLGIKDVTN